MTLLFLAMAFSLHAASTPLASTPLDLTHATIFVENAASIPISATVLSEEVAKRTGVTWSIKSEKIAGPAVVIMEKGADQFLGAPVPIKPKNLKPEGFAIFVDPASAAVPVVWVVGADKRGALFGVGKLLRNLDWKQGAVGLSSSLKIESSPQYPIRGHQLGYRHAANSWDAWSIEQYDQYIRDLALFGTNCIENIPSQDERRSPVMKMSRPEMNKAISAICAKYDLDYWVWTPADFDLADKEKYANYMKDYEQFLAYTPRLDHIFFPGGDPGDNPPEKVMPFLDELSVLVAKYHPKAKIWISLQGFNKEQVDYFHKWIDEHLPKWFAGAVYGPSSPPIAETRARLPKQYAMRHYPDITHNVRAEYPIPWWDPAYAFTLGREAINPRPTYYAQVHNLYAPYTVGFLSYSDGVHDDVNKIVWSSMAWDSTTDVRQVIIDYSRVFFNSEAAPQIADAILALEKNWEGPLPTNGSVDSTWATWNNLAPMVKADNWRWQMCLLRANYDYYVRHRLLYERQLESQVNDVLLNAEGDTDKAIEQALAILQRADKPEQPEIRQKIIDLCAALWESIGLQTSVEKYNASGLERGAVLDFIDYPLNNRRWLEDEMAKVKALPNEQEKVARLKAIATWEHPAQESHYDSIGDVSKVQHLIRAEDSNTDPAGERHPIADFMWMEEGRTRVRQSWIGFMNWPTAMRYEGLDANADYVIRETGYGECLLRADGQRLTPTLYGKETGAIKEFPVPRELYKDGVLVITFDTPDEKHLNWRQQSRLNELWVIRRP